MGRHPERNKRGSRKRAIAPTSRVQVDGAHLYRTLAEVEPSPSIAEIDGRLADIEDDHAQLWKSSKSRRWETGNSAAGELADGRDFLITYRI